MYNEHKVIKDIVHIPFYACNMSDINKLYALGYVGQGFYLEPDAQSPDVYTICLVLFEYSDSENTLERVAHELSLKEKRKDLIEEG